MLMMVRHETTKLATHLQTCAQTCAGLSAAIFCFIPQLLCAQNVDSLTARLGASESGTRWEAVASLSRLPAASLPATTRKAIIALLEREATGALPLDAATPAGPDESYPEYIIALTSLVRSVGDASALRGMVLLGIETSRDAEQFVAGYGAQSLPFLDEAWRTHPNARPSVIETWAILAQQADSSTQMIALQHMVAPDDTFPIALAYAVSGANLVAFVPLFDSLAQAPSLDAMVKASLVEVANQLRPAFTQLNAFQTLALYTTLLDAICLNSTGDLNGYCESSANDPVNSTKRLLKDSGQLAQQGMASQARQEIQQVIGRTTGAIASGVLSTAQGVILIAGLNQVLAKLPR